MNRLIVILLLIFAFSCSKDDENQDDSREDIISIDQIIECLGTAEVPFGLSTCENFPSSDFFCEVETIGEFELVNSSKEFMVHACHDLGDRLVYKNEDEEKIEFEIVNKTYRKLTGVYNSGEICQGDSSKYEGICLQSEAIILDLMSEIPELELKIEISVRPDVFSDEIGGIGDFLQISRTTGVNSFLREFQAVLSKRTLSYERTFFQENLSSVEILDEEFSDVISNDISNFVNDPFKYYYNKSFGLIGFQDQDGVIWKLN